MDLHWIDGEKKMPVSDLDDGSHEYHMYLKCLYRIIRSKLKSHNQQIYFGQTIVVVNDSKKNSHQVI